MELSGLANYIVFLLVFVGIYGIVAIGLNIQWGFAGLFNAGIAGFFAIGAYTSAILTSPPAAHRLGGFDLPMPVGLLGAMALAGLVAWPVGKICLRFRSDYLAIVTIGIAEIIRLVIRSEAWLTNAAVGIAQVPRPFGAWPYAQSQLAYMAMTWLIVGVVYWLVQREVASPWGRMMRAIRDNEDAARAMGKAIETRRLQAFVFGSVLMGLGGALFAHFNRSMTPDAVDPMMATFLVWIMVILGGSGNNRGVLAGAGLIWAIWSLTELVTDLLPTDVAIQAKYGRVFLIGLALQLVLRFRPEGLFPEPSGDPEAGPKRPHVGTVSPTT